jgi:hypothetical protein
MLAFVPQNCRTAKDGAPEPLVLLSATVAVQGSCKVSTVASRRICGGPALWLPQAAMSGALGGGTLPHPCSPNRRTPLDAPPCREAATRRALRSGVPAFELCYSSACGCSRVSWPAAPQRAAATTSLWSCPARWPSTSHRVLRLVLLEADHRAMRILLQVWACGSPESSVPQRLGPGSPRLRAGAAAVASSYPGAARYASRQRPRGLASGSRLAVQLKGLETTRSLAPQRIEGSPPAVREPRQCKNAPRT